MRTASVIVAAFLLVAKAAFAQVPAPERFGIRGGVGLSDLRSDAIAGYSKKAGAKISAFGEWTIVGPASLLIEIGYAGMGYEDVEFYPTGVRSARVIRAPARLDMLSVPVTAKIEHELGGVSPFIVVGPRLDVLLHVSQPTWRFPDGATRTGNADHRPLGVGVTVGAGVAREMLGGHYMSLELRYYADALDTFYRNPVAEGRSQAYELLVGIGLW